MISEHKANGELVLRTIVVMHTFRAAQPALLYLSPACIFSVLLLAAIRGELKDFWSYTEETDEPEESKADDEADADKEAEKQEESRHGEQM